MNTLIHMHCQARSGREHVLSAEDCAYYLQQLQGWQIAEQGQALHKTVHFKNYHLTMAFVNALAYIAHQEDHHPDLGVFYNRCEIRFSSHDVGGLSLNDFICAAKADALISR